MNVRDTENSRLLDSTQEEEPEDEAKESKFFNPLITIIVFLVVSMIGLLILIAFWKFEWASKEIAPKFCMTPECITLSSILLNWQNRSADPCDDFYEYACGMYQEHTLNDGTRINEKDRIVSKLIGSFVRKKDNTTSKSEKALRLLYNACTISFKPENLLNNEISTKKEAFQNIAKIGKWPIAHPDWNESDFNINDMLTNMAKLHMIQFGFFETGVVEYPINESPKQLVVRPAMARFIVPLNELVKTVKEILKLSGVDRKKEELMVEVRESLDLDRELSRFHVNLQAESVSFSKLKEAVPEIDFERIIRSYLNPERGDWLRLKRRISSANFDSFFGSRKNISSIIAATKPRILANYLILKYVEYSYFYYTFPVKELLEGDHCLEIVTAILPRASLRVFVRNHFKKENLVVASEMVEEIKRSFMEMIQNSTWLHPDTKTNAIRKVEKMKKLVGYTEEYEKEGALDKMFETLDVNEEDSFFTLMTKINRFKTEQLMDYASTDSLLNPVDTLVVANAFYYPTKNSLNILIPFLDKPIFDFKYPRYVTMAGVGRVIAHEIGHAFDNKGRETDEIGQIRDWWTPRDSIEYEDRAKCFAEQFEEFHDPSFIGERKGEDVLPEVLADALGIEATWIAFKKLDLRMEERLIQFENHSFRKLFFEIAALDFCSRTDTHSPNYFVQFSHPSNRFRINGAFGNSPSFTEAFGCPVGSKMNPEKRCRMF